jgi:hypothetical protein
MSGKYGIETAGGLFVADECRTELSRKLIWTDVLYEGPAGLASAWFGGALKPDRPYLFCGAFDFGAVQSPPLTGFAM